MKKVFYKVKFTANCGIVEKSFDDLDIAKQYFNYVKNDLKHLDVKLFIVNEIEEELSIEHLPT